MRFLVVIRNSCVARAHAARLSPSLFSGGFCLSGSLFSLSTGSVLSPFTRFGKVGRLGVQFTAGVCMCVCVTLCRLVCMSSTRWRWPQKNTVRLPSPFSGREDGPPAGPEDDQRGGDVRLKVSLKVR